MGLEPDGLHGRYLLSLNFKHQILHALNFDKFGGGGRWKFTSIFACYLFSLELVPNFRSKKWPEKLWGGGLVPLSSVFSHT